MGLALLRALGMSAEQSAEIGSWANLSAFSVSYARLGASDVLASAIHEKLVHRRPTDWCGAAASPRTPSSKQAEGGRGEEEAEHQDVGPALPTHVSPEVLPSPAVSSQRVVVTGWRKSPRHGERVLPAKRSASMLVGAQLDERPKKQVKTASGRVCTKFVTDDL